MIIALFIFTILNYYTFAFDLPEWFQAISLISQCVCVVIAMAIWCGWVDSVKSLILTSKNNKDKRNDNKQNIK